jgi:hypothetical protein
MKGPTARRNLAPIGYNIELAINADKDWINYPEIEWG